MRRRKFRETRTMIHRPAPAVIHESAHVEHGHAYKAIVRQPEPTLLRLSTRHVSPNVETR